MDLWEKFGMSEGIAELWQELGISAATALVVLIALYFVIKWAVKNGRMEALTEKGEEYEENNFICSFAAICRLGSCLHFICNFYVGTR